MKINILIIILSILYGICCESSNENFDEESQEMIRVNKDEYELIRKEMAEIPEFGDIKELKLNDEELEKEKVMEAGDPADHFGTNQHYSIPIIYDDFGRRFVLTYPYTGTKNTMDSAEIELDNAVKEFLEAKKEANSRLMPVKAPPEFVLSIARQSALLEADKPRNPSDDFIRKNILRTGDFWDGVWKENVDMDNVLRTSHIKSNDFKDSVSVKTSPGSKLYELLSILQERSPKLLYVVNKNE